MTLTIIIANKYLKLAPKSKSGITQNFIYYYFLKFTLINK
jgi:hypothetical protein